MRLLLDTGVLGEICHPAQVRRRSLLVGSYGFEHDVLVSEVADYELHRELLCIESHDGIGRLDELTEN